MLNPNYSLLPSKALVIVIIVVVIIVTHVPFFVFRSVLMHHRVLEGANCKADIITGNDSTANGTAKDLPLRGGKAYPKG